VIFAPPDQEVGSRHQGNDLGQCLQLTDIP